MYIYILHNIMIGFSTRLHLVLEIMCNIWNKLQWKDGKTEPEDFTSALAFSSRSEGNCPMNLWPQPSHHHSLLNSSPCYHDRPERLQRDKRTYSWKDNLESDIDAFTLKEQIFGRGNPCATNFQVCLQKYITSEASYYESG